MSNPIETPHVILGIKGPFQDFEDIRRGQKDTPISAWYEEAIAGGGIWLSTLENSDIISFSHKFNSEPCSQSEFCNPDHQHIITGDLRIIENNKLTLLALTYVQIEHTWPKYSPRGRKTCRKSPIFDDFS